jgi:peptidoglycan/LPS O-acetylase OafA/YrhL
MIYEYIEMTDTKNSIVTLQVLRGIAAISVAFYHVYIILMQPEYGGNVVFQPFARFGFLGVSFFFALSGFIIFTAHWKDLGTPRSIPTYLYKRVTRVYPVYWVYLTCFILAGAAGIGYPDFSWAPANLISSYLLIPFVSDMTLPLKVAWTLVYEIRFYIFFIVLLVFGFRAIWAFVVWGALILVSFFAGVETVPDVLSLWNIYFLAGMVGFLVLDRIPVHFGVALFCIGIFLFVLFVLLGDDIKRIAQLDANHPELHLILAPAFLALILGGVLMERAYDLRFPRILQLLGDASYSIYLVHSAAISVIVLISKKLGLIEMLGVQAFFIFTFLLAVAAGTIAYFVVEKPFVGLFRGLLVRIRATRQAGVRIL